MIIGFMGKKQSGKDTAAKFLINNYSFKRYAFGDPVKKICKIMFGFNDEQLYGDKKECIDPDWNISPRQAFQVIGTEFAQFGIYKHLPELNEKVPHRELWVMSFKKWYWDNLKEDRNLRVVISDVRFSHEVNAIRELGGIIVKINKDNIPLDSHTSEKEMDNISPHKIDYKISNNEGIPELNTKINQIYCNVDKNNKNLKVENIDL
jgi:hypothetical protein